MIHISSDKFSDLYSEIVFSCLTNYDYNVSPRGLRTIELIGVNLELTNPLSNFFKNTVRQPSKRYLAGELIWYFSGNNDADFINYYSKFWSTIKNHDNSLNSSYGHTIFKIKNEFGFSQWEWAVQSLKNDKYSRQSVLLFNMPRFQFTNNKDYPCTANLHFLIRQNKLVLFTNMRANDLFRGIVYDLPFFTLLMQCMKLELKAVYPNLELGSYFHQVNSVHIYNDNIEIIKQMIRQPISEAKLPELQLNPILSKQVIGLYNKIRYSGDDKFHHWLSTNALQ